MRRGIFFFGVAAAIAATGCGAGRIAPSAPATVAVAPPAAPPGEPMRLSASPEQPREGFGVAMLEAAGALLAAARGAPHDAKWDCDDASTDLRATSVDAKKRLDALGGISELVVLGIDGVTMASPLRPAPEDDRALGAKSAAPQWLQITADVAVWPDARVRWSGLRSSIEGAVPELSEASLLRIKALPVELRGLFGDLVQRLGGPSCDIPLMTKSDLEALSVVEDVKKAAADTMARDARRVPEACEDMASATGPWEVRVQRLNVIARAGKTVVRLRSALRIDRDRVCLGPAEVQLSD